MANGPEHDGGAPTPNAPSTLLTVVTLGSTVVGAIVSGLLLGLLGDHVCKTSPLLLLLGLLLGIVAAGFALKGAADRLGGRRG